MVKIKYGIKERGHWFEDCYEYDCEKFNPEDPDSLELYIDDIAVAHYMQNDGWDWWQHTETMIFVVWNLEGKELGAYKVHMEFIPSFTVTVSDETIEVDGD